MHFSVHTEINEISERIASVGLLQKIDEHSNLFRKYFVAGLTPALTAGKVINYPKVSLDMKLLAMSCSVWLISFETFTSTKHSLLMAQMNVAS